MIEVRAYTVRDLVRSPALRPLPALLVQGIVLVVSSRVWAETIPLRSRSGTDTTSPAALSMGLSAALMERSIHAGRANYYRLNPERYADAPTDTG